MKKLHKFCSFLVASSMVVLPMCTISSCSLQGDISFSIPEMVTEDYFEIDCTFSRQPSSSVQVQIVENNSNEIRLCDPVLIVENKKTKLRFEILTDISQHFNFKLLFQFNNFEKKRQIVLSEEQSLYYSCRSKPDENRVVPSARRVITQNIHTVEFNFIFYISSQVSVVELNIINSTSDLISLDKGFCDVKYDSKKGQWIANIKINIDTSIREITFFNFDLNFSFINTFGKKQNTVIEGLSIGYIYFLTDVMPEDYFKIEVVEGDKYTLVGLNDWVDPNLANLFSVIKIPDNINYISDYAFQDALSLDHIKKIVFDDKLTKVGLNSFIGCKNLMEIDISAYTVEPEWITNSDYYCFGNNKIADGYIWVNEMFQHDFDYYETLKTHLYEKCGLPNKWEVFSTIDVTPPELFQIDGGELTGFIPKTVYDLEKYEVIRIPEEVTSLQDNSIRALARLPFKNPRNNGKQYTTRRLILSPNISKLGKINYVGLGGPFIFDLPNLTEIPDFCFQDAPFYDYGAVPDYNDVEYEPITLNFIHTDQLSSINSCAFYEINAVGTISFPSSVKEVQEKAFFMNDFDTIEIQGPNLETVGTSAFARYDGLANTTLKNIYLTGYSLSEKYVEWLFDKDILAFKNTCTQTGGVVHFSAKSRDQILSKFTDFLNAQGIPEKGWTLKID